MKSLGTRKGSNPAAAASFSAATPINCHVVSQRRSTMAHAVASGAATSTGPSSFERFTVVAKTYAVGALDSVVTVVENISGRLGWQMVTPKVCKAPLTGKVCIITGANAGIGLATAELLACRGAHVIMACRSRERGEAAAAAIRERCTLLPGCGTSPKLEVMEVDMASLNSVRQFCRTFNQRQLPLHLLVANAGIMSPATRLQTPDNLEMQFQVNFLSHWLMTQELLAEQRRRRAARKPTTTTKQQQGALHIQADATTGGGAGGAAGAGAAGAGAVVEGALPGWGLKEDGTRVVMVSSLTHYAGSLNWHDMQSTTVYDPFTSYALSKMCNAMTAVELQRRLDKHQGGHSGTAAAAAAGGGGGKGGGKGGAALSERSERWGVNDSVVAVHPGVVDTYLANNFFKTQGVVAAWPASKRVIEAVVDSVGPLIMKTPASSAAVMGAAALAPAGQVAGQYLVNGRPSAPATAVRDPRLAAQLWDEAQRLTGLTIDESLA